MKTLMIVAAAMAAIPALAQPPQGGSAPRVEIDPGHLIFYNQTNYNGEEYEIDSLKRVFRWDYNIRSIAMRPGDRWQICAQPRFAQCILLDRSVPDATMIGITASIGSIRPAPADAPRQGN